MGAQVADGKVECVKVVRRQIGAGTDWIKVKRSLSIYAGMSLLAPRFTQVSQRSERVKPDRLTKDGRLPREDQYV